MKAHISGQGKESKSDKPSLCIPRATGFHTSASVHRIIEPMFRSCIERIIVNPRKDRNGAEYSQIFIHLSRWPDSERMKSLWQRITDGKSIQIVYSYPYFWKCYKCRPREKPATTVARGWVGEIAGLEDVENS